MPPDSLADSSGNLLHVSIQNTNRAGASHMSPEECVRAFLPGVKGFGGMSQNISPRR
jgi:hypothetical protein